eukprot:jgi/Mesen1/390/ME000010S_10862
MRWREQTEGGRRSSGGGATQGTGGNVVTPPKPKRGSHEDPSPNSFFGGPPSNPSQSSHQTTPVAAGSGTAAPLEAEAQPAAGRPAQPAPEDRRAGAHTREAGSPAHQVAEEPARLRDAINQWPGISKKLLRLIDTAMLEPGGPAVEHLKRVLAGLEPLRGPEELGWTGEGAGGEDLNQDLHQGESTRGAREGEQEEEQERGGEGEEEGGLGGDYAQQAVDILLAKMGGGGGDEFDDLQWKKEKEQNAPPPEVMLSGAAARVAGEILPWLRCGADVGRLVSPRTKLARALAGALQACVRNRAMCHEAGLLPPLLEAARVVLCGEDMWDPTPLFRALELTAGHSLDVLAVRQWMAAVADVTRTGRALELVLALERAIAAEQARGPGTTFEFDGESSGLLGPGEAKWPFSGGYAFATWLYVETFGEPAGAAVGAAAMAASIASAASSRVGRSSAMSVAAVASALAGEGMAHMPRLFSFLTADSLGVEAYFHKQFLVVETVGAKGRKASFHFTHAFASRRWYFIGLEHTHRWQPTVVMGARAESEIRLYIDGHLAEARALELPRISKPLAFCCIGTNPPAAMAGLQRRRRQCPLFAEMGPVYIFKEPIGGERMARLAGRRGDYLATFGSAAGPPWLATADHVGQVAEDWAALDAELAPKLHLLYHPALLVGRSCPDASPAGASGTLSLSLASSGWLARSQSLLLGC